MSGAPVRFRLATPAERISIFGPVHTAIQPIPAVTPAQYPLAPPPAGHKPKQTAPSRPGEVRPSR